ncbi:sugar kinase [Gilvimarinus polysaccharolyticus]|uniref:sugar kinase n=1 Tax=Gilvimarinus polysaccharolyticus TaxID=863921 RepID=UPI000A06989E|nr:sugar kinase [Gilvimarinus polysaccharolyticus]
MKNKIVTFGECMLELSQFGGQDYRLAYGGDTLNSAVYMARAGADVSFLTALGCDQYSDYLIGRWRQEGVGTELVRRFDGKVPGLYIIATDDNGERSFEYWRQAAPVKDLIKLKPEALTELADVAIFYLSGITLSLFDTADRRAILEFLTAHRARGGVVAFDTNYRAKGWQSPAQAQDAISTILAQVDIALPSFDDEQELFGFATIDACVEHYRQLGVNEVVIKDGKNGCYSLINGELSRHPLKTIVKPVDTTSAGDSFNGAYIAAKSLGKSVADSIVDGQACAAYVIQHPGAIVDRENIKH